MRNRHRRLVRTERLLGDDDARLDPHTRALRVRCPDCGAHPGEPCIFRLPDSPAASPKSIPHRARRQEAASRGLS